VSALAGRLRDPWNWIAGAVLLFLIGFVVAPLFQLFAQSFVGQRSGAIGIENYVTFFGSRYFTRALINSMTIGVFGTVIALALGVPLAYLCARYVMPGIGALRVLIILAMISPPFLGAYAWIILFGRAGIVTGFFRMLGIETPTIYGPGGIAIVTALHTYPIVFLITYGAFRRIDRSLEEAAQNLGRDRWGVIRTVTLPLIMPALLTSALLVFLAIIADFGTVNLLGEGERFPVLATLAYQLYVNEIGEEPGMAATTSAVLLAIAFAVILVQRKLIARRSVVNDGAQPPLRLNLTGGARLLAPLYACAIVAISNIALTVVVVTSFLEVRGAVFQATPTLQNYVMAFDVLSDALTNSLSYSAAALAVIVVVGGLIGYLISRRDTPLTRTVDLLVMIPYIVPGTVLGIGYAATFNGPPLALTATAAIIIIVYIVRRIPYMIRAAASIVFQIDPSLEEASVNLGVSPLRTFRKIMAPLMGPGLVAGATLAWIEVFNELSASIVLYTAFTRTLPVATYLEVFSSNFGAAAALATLLIAMTALALALFTWLGGADKEMTL
jgi:iron(III) transport system permease protein